MGGVNKKRLREEQELNLPEECYGQKQGRLMDYEVGLASDKPENVCNQNFPELCSLSNEYSMLLKDPVSWEDKVGFGIRSIAIIREQSYILDYLHESAVDNSRAEVAEHKKVQVEEEDCLRGSLFEATDDQLWKPQSPLSGTEALFSLDFMGRYDCTGLLQDESIDRGTASCFSIWEQDYHHKDEKNQADGIGLVSDSIWGAPSDQSQFSETVEFETSLPSL